MAASVLGRPHRARSQDDVPWPSGPYRPILSATLGDRPSSKRGPFDSDFPPTRGVELTSVSPRARVGPSKSAKGRGDTKPRGPPNVFGRPASLGPGQSMRSPVWPYRPTKGAMRASCSAIASSRVNVGSGAGTAGVEVGWLLAVAGARTSPRGSSRSPPKLTAPAANEATMATTKPAPMSGTRARCWRSGV